MNEEIKILRISKSAMRASKIKPTAGLIGDQFQFETREHRENNERQLVVDLKNLSMFSPLSKNIFILFDFYVLKIVYALFCMKIMLKIIILAKIR